MTDAPLRPRDFALFLLGSSETAPRTRARDQQGDAAGLALKRRVLADIAAGDPEGEALEAFLMDLVESVGEPTGPTRAIALGVLEEWRFVAGSAEWLPHVIGEAVAPPVEAKGGRRGRNLPA